MPQTQDESRGLNFTANFEVLLQDKGGVLVPYASSGSYSGEVAQVVHQFGEVEFVDTQTRFEETTFSDVSHGQVWVVPSPATLALPIDKTDTQFSFFSFQAPYVLAMVNAYNRKRDASIADSLLGVANTSQYGQTQLPFDTANQEIAIDVGAAADTGLNVSKLIEAKALLMAAYATDEEVPVCIITTKQWQDLMAEAKITSNEYAPGLNALITGAVDMFLGIKFVLYETWKSNSASGTAADRAIPMWVPSGVHIGYWGSLESQVGPRPDLNYLEQIWMRCVQGAVRTQGKKVVVMRCKEDA